MNNAVVPGSSNIIRERALRKFEKGRCQKNKKQRSNPICCTFLSIGKTVTKVK